MAGSKEGLEAQVVRTAAAAAAHQAATVSDKAAGVRAGARRPAARRGGRQQDGLQHSAAPADPRVLRGALCADGGRTGSAKSLVRDLQPRTQPASAAVRARRRRRLARRPLALAAAACAGGGVEDGSERAAGAPRPT